MCNKLHSLPTRTAINYHTPPTHHSNLPPLPPLQHTNSERPTMCRLLFACGGFVGCYQPLQSSSHWQYKKSTRQELLAGGRTSASIQKRKKRHQSGPAGGYRVGLLPYLQSRFVKARKGRACIQRLKKGGRYEQLFPIIVCTTGRGADFVVRITVLLP